MKKGTTGTRYGIRVAEKKEKICVTIDAALLTTLREWNEAENKPFSTLVNDLLGFAVSKTQASRKKAVQAV